MRHFHREVEDLVDMEEVAEDVKQKPQWRFGLKGNGAVKHRMVKVAVGKKLSQCLSCSERSIHGKVSGVCCGLKWINAHKNREQESKPGWTDTFMGGHHLQRPVGNFDLMP